MFIIIAPNNFLDWSIWMSVGSMSRSLCSCIKHACNCMDFSRSRGRMHYNVVATSRLVLRLPRTPNRCRVNFLLVRTYNFSIRLSERSFRIICKLRRNLKRLTCIYALIATNVIQAIPELLLMIEYRQASV